MSKCHGHASLTKGCPECVIDALREDRHESDHIIAKLNETVGAMDARLSRSEAKRAKLRAALVQSMRIPTLLEQIQKPGARRDFDAINHLVDEALADDAKEAP